MHRSAPSDHRRKRSLERPSGDLGDQLTQAIGQYQKVRPEGRAGDIWRREWKAFVLSRSYRVFNFPVGVSVDSNCN